MDIIRQFDWVFIKDRQFGITDNLYFNKPWVQTKGLDKCLSLPHLRYGRA